MRLSSLLLALGFGFAAAVVPLDATSLLNDGLLDIGPRQAHGAISIAYSLDELVNLSQRVVVATAVERKSRWEHVAGSRRIVTYTKLKIAKSVYGKAAKHVTVRTLGGAVRKVGQQVAGEASLPIGSESLLFLTKSGSTWLVTGMAQGHYPLRVPKKKTAIKVKTLVVSPSLGTVLRRRGPTISAQETLIGLKLADAVTKIRQVKARLDAARKKK